MLALFATTACGDSCGNGNGTIADTGGGGNGGGDTADMDDITEDTFQPPEDGGDTAEGDGSNGGGDAADVIGGDAKCGPDACTPGENRCTEEGKSQTCVPGPGGCGRWGQSSECGDGEFCQESSGLCEDKADFPCHFQSKCSANANCTKDSEAEDGFVCTCHGQYTDYRGDGSLCLPDYFETADKGDFQMGSPSGETGRDDDETQHPVEITYPFAIQKYEVTQATWGEFEENDEPWNGTSNCTQTVCPVFNVSWWDALHFANQMSKAHELETCYELKGCSGTPGADLSCSGVEFKGLDCNGWRLPTEAEWEYAARAGTQTATYNGDLSDPTTDETVGAIAWYQDNAEGETHEWGGKKENAWGLHDFSGNVSEWVWDRYGSYPSGSQTDPTGPDSGSERVVRGGHWDSPAKACRSAARDKASPDTRNEKIGFRVVRTLPEK